MPSVNIKESEPFDVAIRRFKRACEKAGIPSKLRQIEFYEKPTARRKRKHAAAIKRWSKKLQKEQEIMNRMRAKYPKHIAIIVSEATTTTTTATTETTEE